MFPKKASHMVSNQNISMNQYSLQMSCQYLFLSQSICGRMWICLEQFLTEARSFRITNLFWSLCCQFVYLQYLYDFWFYLLQFKMYEWRYMQTRDTQGLSHLSRLANFPVCSQSKTFISKVVYFILFIYLCIYFIFEHFK